MAKATGASELRLTLIEPDGTVIADTRADAAAMENHGSRPEVRAALAGKMGEARRRSATMGRDLVYTAVPVSRRGRIVAVLRVSTDVPSLFSRLSSELGSILLLVLAFVAAAAVAAALFSRRLALPLARLASTAQGYASGALPLGLGDSGDRGRRSRLPAALSARPAPSRAGPKSIAFWPKASRPWPPSSRSA